jgi:hypothetical protein
MQPTRSDVLMHNLAVLDKQLDINFPGVISMQISFANGVGS